MNSARLPPKWRKLAERRCREEGARLTPARLATYAELLASSCPLSAYELVALLGKRQQRKIAPLTVYRHLDFLIGIGLVHRLETTQSYIACDHPSRAHDSHYLLCSSCGHVDELESRQLESVLCKLADSCGFQPERAVVEVKGRCGACVDAEDASTQTSTC